MLPLKMQRPPGCRQHHHAGSGREQRGHDLGRAVQLFEIVQDQQGLTVAEMLGHGAGFAAAHIQALGDRLPHHLGITHGRQRDEEDIVRRSSAERGGGRQGQPRLAHAAGPGERQQPDVRRRDGSAQPLKILDPAD